MAQGGPASGGAPAEPAFDKEIGRIWKDVHDQIDPIRAEVYRLLGPYVRRAPGTWIPIGIQPPPPATIGVGGLDLPPPDHSDSNAVQGYLANVERLARGSEQVVQGLGFASPPVILDITARAGCMLGISEELKIIGSLNPPAAPPKPPLPTLADSQRVRMTVTATARDHIRAADGHVKNFRATLAQRARRKVVGWYLLPAVLLYLGFLFLQLERPIPGSQAVYLHIAAWSWFGAVCLSLIRIPEDAIREEYDPRHSERYSYRILVAPFASLAFLFLLANVSAGTAVFPGGSGATVVIDLANPNLPWVAFLAFLTGFFARRTLSGLNNAWRRLFPSEEAEGKKTPKTAAQTGQD